MTQVSWKKPLILAVTLFVLSLVAYWLEYKHKPETEAKEAQTKKIFDLKDTSVESIAISNGTIQFTLSCEDFAAKLCKTGDSSKWDVSEPTKLRADDSNANSLLSALASTESADSIDLKDETPEKRAALLKDYGLDAAGRATDRKIDVKTSKGEFVAYFGATHPIGEGVFTAIEKVPAGGKPSGAIDDTKILLTPSYFKNNFDHDLTYWRDKKILTDIHANDIASFKLESAKNGKLSGARANGEWSVSVGKDSYPGDNENVDTLINGVSFLAAKDFASEDKSDAKALAALKGTKPVLTLTIQKQTPTPAPAPSGTPAAPPEAPKPIVITFLTKGDATKPATPKSPKDKTPPPASKLYVTVSDKAPLYEVDGYAKDRFEKGLKDLRMSKLLTSLDRFAAKRMEFSGQPIGATPIILTYADGKWSYSPSKKEADTSKAQSVLDKLSSSRIREFMEGSSIPAGQDKGLKISIGDEKSPDHKQFVLWQADGKVYGRDLTSGRNEAGQLDQSVAGSFPFDAASAATFFDKSATPAPAPGAPPNVKAGATIPGLPMGHPPISGHPVGHIPTPTGQSH